MTRDKSIIKNSIFNTIKTFSSLVFPVLSFAYASRILGEEGIGRVNFARSFITYFSMFAMLGMNYYGTREAAKLRNDRQKLSKFTHEMLLINGCTTFLAYLFLGVAIFAVQKLRDYTTLLAISSAAILLQGMGMEWLYQAMEEYRYIAVRSVLFQFGAFAAMLLLVRDAGDVEAYALVMLLASYGAYILNFINARKLVSFKRQSAYRIKEHIKPLLWLFAMAVSIELYTVLDSTMLGFLKGDAAVGRYTAAVKVNKLVNSLITAIGVVLIPRLSYYISQGETDRVNELVSKAYNYIFLLSVPAAVGLFMLSDEIILLFSGKGFASAAVTMRILTPIVLVIPFSVVTNQQTLIPMGKEKLILLSTSTGAVTNLIFNSVLIPKFAENGAAIATVLAETAVAGVCFINIGRYQNRKKIFSTYWQYWTAALPMLLMIGILNLLPINYLVRTAIVIFTSIICYFSMLLVLKNPYIMEAFQTIKSKVWKLIN